MRRGVKNLLNCNLQIKKLRYMYNDIDTRKCCTKKVQSLWSVVDPCMNFVPPKINFQASYYSYIEIINWNSCVVCPPSMLRYLSEDDIKSLINSDTTLIREIQKFPCHTQAVERCVKLVTEGSIKVCRHEARDGHIRATLKYR